MLGLQGNNPNNNGYVATTYFEYHGVEPGAYYGLEYRRDLPNPKGWSAGRKGAKKSFASRLSSQFDKLKPRGRDKGALGATDRSPSAGWVGSGGNPDLAFMERYGQFVVASPSPVMSKGSPFNVRHGTTNKYSPIMRPKRTFRNVMPVRATGGSGKAPPGGSSSSRYHFHSPLPAAWVSAEPAATTPNFHHRQHFVHRPHYVDMIDDDFYEACECFPPNSGRCRRCATGERPKVLNGDRIRRVQSEESVTHTTVDDYEVIRRRRQVEGRLCFYDDDLDNGPNVNDDHVEERNSEEHDLAYAEADYIYSAMNRRPPPLPLPPGMAAHRPNTLTTRKSPSRAVFDSLRRSSVGEKKPLARSSSSVVQRPSSAASRVLSSTLTRPERKSKEKSPTTFHQASNTTNVTNIRHDTAPLASVIAVSSAAATLKRDEEANRSRLATLSNASDKVRVDVAENSITYLNPDTQNGTILTSDTITASRVPTTTTVRVTGGDFFEDKNLATTITVHGTEGGNANITGSTSDKETTDEETSHTKDDREMAQKLADQNAERLRKIRETRRRLSPSVNNQIRSSPLSVDEDSDYDADCSATESPRKFQRVPRVASSSSSSSSSSTRSKTSPSRSANTIPLKTSHGVTIFEEEEEDEPESMKNRIIRRIDTSSCSDQSVRDENPVQISTTPTSSKLLQLYQRRNQHMRTPTGLSEESADHEVSPDDELGFEPVSQVTTVHLSRPTGVPYDRSRMDGSLDRQIRKKPCLFNDTTRLRVSCRPALTGSTFNAAAVSEKLARSRVISQSFRDKLAASPSRPKDPPPPPPLHTMQRHLLADLEDGPIRILHTSSVVSTAGTAPTNPNPTKPPRHKKTSRSNSFSPQSHGALTTFFTRSFGHITKSLSASSLDDVDKCAIAEPIYEEIPSEPVASVLPSRGSSVSSTGRPLPPVPTEERQSPRSSSPLSSIIPKKISTTSSMMTASTATEEVKSIFEGATKYEILHYLADAKERGLTDVELELNDEPPTVEEIDRNHSIRVSQLSNNSASSSGSSGPVLLATKDRWSSVDIERNDSGLGSETGKKGKRPIRLRGDKIPDITSQEHICEDCDQIIEDTNETDFGEGVFDPNGLVCLQCAKRRCERKEIITEIIETEIKYGRDLRIIQDEFYRPMRVAGLLTQDQLSSIFLNVDELTEVNRSFTDSLKDAIEIALDEGDDDLCTVKIGKIFLLSNQPMLEAFKSYCTRQGSASALLAGLEKDRELLRIFLKVSQMENTILRRMNLSSFLMVPVQRVTKYPLLLSRLLKVTPTHHEDRSALQESREKIEHALEHMNQETRGDTSGTKLWRRISMINVASYRRMDNQLDVLGNTTWGIRKMALDVLQWSKENREDVNFVLEGKVYFNQQTESATSNWKRMVGNARTNSVSALLVTLGKNGQEPPNCLPEDEANLQFPKDTGVREAALLLIREKNSRYNMVREPIFLDKCIICWEQDWEDSFEIQDFYAKESFAFSTDSLNKTRQWFRALQFYGLSLGIWRRRRNALANIMINGMARKED